MLSPADQALVDRDGAIVGLGLLLDPVAMCEVLGLVGAVDGAVRVHPRYVRYKPGTNVLVAYDVLGRDGHRVVHAKAYGSGTEPDVAMKVRKSGLRAGAALSMTRGLLADRGVVVSPFPVDRKVRQLAALACDARRGILLGRVVPARPDLWGAALRPLSYKPERRFVGALSQAGTPVAVVRAYPAGTRLPRWNAADGDGGLPALLGKSGRRGVWISSWIDGTPLDQILAGDQAREAAAATGRAVAVLHTRREGRLPVRRLDAEHRAIFAAAALAGDLLPELRPAARALAARLEASLRPAPRVVTAHGDLHAGQVIVGADGVSLVDLDEACRAAAGADLGSLLASVLAAAAGGQFTMAAARVLCDDLVEGYARESGQVPEALHAWVAAHLLRRTPQAFRERHVDWAAVTTGMLTLAQAACEQSCWSRPAVSRLRSRAPVTAADDPGLPALRDALDVDRAGTILAPYLPGDVRVRAARLVRHKPGRRGLIAYELTGSSPEPGPVQTVIGKLRARGADERTAALMDQLWRGPFAPDSPHGASVPQPLGVVPALSMWLQAQVPGTVATEWAWASDAIPRMRRAAAAVRRLHTSGLRVARMHTVTDEIAILQSRLARLAAVRPDLESRVGRLGRVVESDLLNAPAAPDVLLHRDLHPDHLLWSHDARLYLIDFDLAAHGDPGVDVGNLAAHLLELGVRHCGDVQRLRPVADAFVEAYLEATPDLTAGALDAWTTAALARLAALSVDLPGREATTDQLVTLCEGRLDVAGAAGRSDAQPPREVRS